MTRVPAIASKSDVPAEHHDLVDHVVKVFGALRGPASVLLHSPKMAWSVFNLGDYFRDSSIVEPQVRHIATSSTFRASGPSSASWTAPSGSCEVVKSHFG